VTQFFTALWAHHTELLADLGAVVLGATATLKALEVLAALLSSLFPGVAAFAQADGALKTAIGWALALLDRLSVLPKLPKPAPKALMALALPLLMAGSLFIGGRADASGLDYAVGPTIPMLEYDLGSAKQVQLAPGAGVQVSITHESLKRALFGKSWDLVALTGTAFGSKVAVSGGETFGALSVAGGLSFMSNLVMVGVGTHVLSDKAALAPGHPFLLFALNFNFAISPSAPAGSAKASLPRANTIYFGAP
jgi:hypothetical protein